MSEGLESSNSRFGQSVRREFTFAKFDFGNFLDDEVFWQTFNFQYVGSEVWERGEVSAVIAAGYEG